MTPSFTVVIPVRNAHPTIAATLHSIVHASPAAEEIVCVDDASTDSSVEEIRRFAADHHPPLRLIAFDTRCGPAVARNRGAAAAHSPLVVFVDSDVVLRPDALALLLQQYATQGCGAVVAVYHEKNAAGGILSDFTTFYSAFTYRSGRGGSLSHFSSQCALINRDEFLRVGGFDERFHLPTVEDIELGLRLREAGAPVTVVPRAQVIHTSRYTPRAFIRNYLRKGFDFGWVLRRRRRRGLAVHGYGGLDDIASLGLLGMLGFSALFSRGLPSGTWAVVLVALLVHWRRFIRASSRMGPLRGLLFTPLRAMVLILSAGAACAGFIRSADRPGPWHDR